MSIIRIIDKKGEKYRVVGIPVRNLSSLNKLEYHNKSLYLKELYQIIRERTAKVRISRKTGEKVKKYLDFDIVVPKVMYRQLIIDNDVKYTLGSATYQYNARQLVLSEKSMKILNIDFDKSTASEEEQNKDLMFVYDDILDKVNRFMPLYDKNKFRAGLYNGRTKFEQLPVLSKYKGAKKISDGKLDIINEILTGLHNNASTGNLKSIGIKTPFGMMQSNSGVVLSSNSLIIYQSPTGLFERKVKLANLGR